MTKATNPAVTDAANEFALLTEFLRDAPANSSTAGHIMLGNLIKSSNRTSPALYAASIINKRGDNLTSFVRDLDDDFLTEELKQTCYNAVESVLRVIAPERLGAYWNQSVASYIKNEHLVTLQFMSRIIRRHRALPVVSQIDLEKIRFALDNALAEILSASDLPTWAKHPLIDGIDQLKFKIDNFILFGHDEAVSGLLILHATTVAISVRLEKTGKKYTALRDLALAILLIKDIFTGPTDIAQSLPIWNNWVQELSNITVPLLKAPQRQIEGPKSTTPV